MRREARRGVAGGQKTGVREGCGVGDRLHFAWIADLRSSRRNVRRRGARALRTWQPHRQGVKKRLAFRKGRGHCPQVPYQAEKTSIRTAHILSFMDAAVHGKYQNHLPHNDCLHGASNLSFVVSFLQVLAFVVQPFAFGESNFHLEVAVFRKVGARRYKREPRLRHFGGELEDDALVKEEAPLAQRVMVVAWMAPRPLRDVCIAEKELAIAHAGVRFAQGELSVADRLDFGAVQFDSTFVRVEQLVAEACLSVESSWGMRTALGFGRGSGEGRGRPGWARRRVSARGRQVRNEEARGEDERRHDDAGSTWVKTRRRPFRVWGASEQLGALCRLDVLRALEEVI